MATDDLSDAQAAIVAVLRDGRATTGYLADEVDYSNVHINTQLRILLAKDVIRKVHPPTALYELVGQAQERQIDTAADELSEPEAALVDILREGRATTGYIAAAYDYSTSHLNTQLQLLLAKGVIRKVHPPTALYELVEKSKQPTDK